MARYTTISEWHKMLNHAFETTGGTVYSSSGSTGPSKSLLYTPTVFRGAVDRTKELCAAIPISNSDRVGMCWGYGLFPPAQFYTMALAECGAHVLPYGSGKNFPTELKIIRFCEEPVNGLVGMPSYLLKMAHDMKQQDVLEQCIAELKYLITGGEILDDALRLRLEELYGVPIFDHYGMLQAPMIGGECAQKNCHVASDYAPEVLRSDGTIRADGEGILLLSSPIVWAPLNLNRLLTNDVVRLSHAPCPCGIQTPTIKILGRSDHIMKVRGQKINFPAVFSILSELGVNEYYFEIIRSPTDTITLHLQKSIDKQAVRQVLQKEISVRYDIATHTDIELPTTNTGKSTRIVVTKDS